jgi:phosphoribosylformimino-5-aminoimidazole carboxamide ribotide isomerase
MMFRIYPAVDIKGGKCVRLYQGDLSRETVFSENPWEMALTWEKQGASYLHVVDLDGAAAGRPINLEAIAGVLEKISVPVQVGGGIRRREDVERLLAMGAQRVVLGSAAAEEDDFLEEAVAEFAETIIVSVDTRGEQVAVSGWTETVNLTIWDVLRRLVHAGVKRIIHTDIARDGTLGGYEEASLEPFLDRGFAVIAAGGITTVSDVARLKSSRERGVEGVIIGRALYGDELHLADVLPLQEDV